MSGVSRTACWIRRLHSLTRSKFFSLFSGKRPSFGRLFLFLGLFFVCDAGWFAWVCRLRGRFGCLDSALVSACFLRGAIGWVGFACFCAGIRVLPSCFTRRPCAGRHLLFFAAAKKSRQKKAANTANFSSCLRAPKGSYASYGSISVCVRCQRFECASHPLQTPVHGLTAANGMCRPGGKLCVGCRVV